MKYYALRPLFTDDTVMIDEKSHYDYSLTLGEKMPPDFPEPMLFVVDPEMGTSVLPSTFLPEPVFRREFIAALRQAGVDNIDTYEVSIKGFDGQPIDGYQAVNILGAVSCANLAESEYEELGEGLVFRRLVIDPARTHGLLMFRLAEFRQRILLAEPIKAKLDERFPDVAFEEVEASP
jgi:hypothetical protein